MNGKVIEVNNVTKLFGKDGITNISFDVKKGSFHALIGSNGAGKTTLIRSILHLYQKYNGKILINGVETSQAIALKDVSYISEAPKFPSELNAQKYLEWAGLLASKDINGINAQIRDLSTKFGINHILKKNPNKLSSGQKQKLLLIKVLIEEGEIIILDEPTANLDPAARIIFFKEMKKLHDQGKSILVCSHNLEEIEDKATWVTILDRGLVVYNSEHDKLSLSELFQSYVLNKEEK